MMNEWSSSKILGTIWFIPGAVGGLSQVLYILLLWTVGTCKCNNDGLTLIAIIFGYIGNPLGNSYTGTSSFRFMRSTLNNPFIHFQLSINSKYWNIYHDTLEIYIILYISSRTSSQVEKTNNTQ